MTFSLQRTSVIPFLPQVTNERMTQTQVTHCLREIYQTMKLDLFEGGVQHLQQIPIVPPVSQIRLEDIRGHDLPYDSVIR